MSCQKPKDQELSDGSSCCSDCHRWLIECEARSLLRYPLERRRSILEDFQKKRGKASVEKLKGVMIVVHKALRKAQH